MFDWVKVVPFVKPVELELEDDGQEGWMLEIRKKEERLARMETRRREWEAGYICKRIMNDIMEAVARSDSENMIESVLDGVVDTAVQDNGVKAIMAEIKEYSLERVIIVEIKKERNSVTRSNRFSNDMSE